MPLTPARFSALARSSPWRWRTLRFTVSWQAPDTYAPRPSPGVRAWLRRPDGLRVEDHDGRALESRLEDKSWGSAARVSSEGRHVEIELFGPLDPRSEPPVLDEEGLVLRRPADWSPLSYDDPMFENYHWVAMLDPAELADGTDPETGDPAPEPVLLENLAEVGHHGRLAWQADLRPTATYDPRCTCCPLLFSQASEDLEAEMGAPVLRDREPALRYADAHRVRLDAETGVCVYTEELGGSHAGTGHDVRIEVVDEPMPDELFAFRTETGRNQP